MAGPKTTDADRRHMRHALALARRGLGRVAPNPAVGCVIIRDGLIVGRGWTQPGGRPHAETVALAQAGDRSQGATAYVSLEPCSHTGQTGPCAEALIGAGIARVVIAAEDPDERVNGRGIEMLRKAGVDVAVGLLGQQARALNGGFILNRAFGRPHITLKLATSMDGRIATSTGESQWITGAAARAAGHMLRATHDAILVGAGTARADDPELTCRIEGLEGRSPGRIVLDSRLSISLTSRLVKTVSQAPVTIFCRGEAPAQRRQALADAGVEVLDVDADMAGMPAPDQVLAALAESGVTRLLIEGGAKVAASFLRAGLVDEIALFRAPKLLGGDGLAAVAGFGLDDLPDAPQFRPAGTRRLGDDVLETYRRPD
ncbi:MAG: bifunctional diaminohydroxyphosphoribosylaminopyrimidine deaminase/5-amino-6-(5-phosphoribosylamino)uracil reductase RibD [Minwuia sp.]|uniref:bifunctional diaminohydroxyphosphoribosylaminopyrimidine deaminase/5-amino-6-(5-phosphoribosylamino)uracil reductase RibD n=1 Tax=Minwuia sp. TaxID=2493630 RepID=UPI003A8A5891